MSSSKSNKISRGLRYLKNKGPRAFFTALGKWSFIQSKKFTIELLFRAKQIRRTKIESQNPRITNTVSDEHNSNKLLASLFLVRRSITPDSEVRVSVVCNEGISFDQLTQGGSDALILGYVTAVNRGSSLRVISREFFPNLDVIKELLIHEGVYQKSIPITGELLSTQKDALLETGQSEIYITTSWQSTHAFVGSSPGTKVVYLVHDDERLFNLSGDAILSANTNLQSDVPKVLSTELLTDYFKQQALVKSGLQKSPSVTYEPTYTRSDKSALQSSKPSGQERVEAHELSVFCSPNLGRTMFNLAMESVEFSVLAGVFHPNWQIRLVGENLPKITSISGIPVVLSENPSWGEYKNIISQSSLGLSLHASIHPGTTVLNFASSNIPVVTNSFASKYDLSNYSNVIRVAEPNIYDISKELTTSANFIESGLSGSMQTEEFPTWLDTLSESVKFVLGTNDSSS